MYTFSSKLKTLSFILLAVGLIGIGIGFSNAPKDIKEVEEILASAGHGHEASHAAKATEAAHQTEGHATAANEVASGHGTGILAKGHAAAHASTEVSAHAEHEEHLNHVLHQLQNKPWAALYVACLFIML